jgi:hypothetical protein
MPGVVLRAVRDKRFWPGVAMAACVGGVLSMATVASAETGAPSSARAAEASVSDEADNRETDPHDPHHGGGGVGSATDDSEFHEVCDEAGVGGAFLGECPEHVEGGGGGAAGGGGVVGEAPEELPVTGPGEDMVLIGGVLTLAGGAVLYATRRRNGEAVHADAAV